MKSFVAAEATSCGAEDDKLKEENKSGSVR